MTASAPGHASLTKLDWPLTIPEALRRHDGIRLTTAGALQSVNLLVSYAVTSNASVAMAGVQLLQSFVAALAPVLNMPGWTTVIQGLSIASSTDHLSAVFNPRCGCVA